MKKIIKTIKTALCIGAAVLTVNVCDVKAQALVYAEAATFWNVLDFTNLTTTASNLASVANLTFYSAMTLEVKAGFTNASTGTLDIQWDTSANGTEFCANKACPGTSGWFAVPLTNGTTSTYWTTNISNIGAMGYWRLNWITNNAVQHMTNVSIRAYVKSQARNN